MRTAVAAADRTPDRPGPGPVPDAVLRSLDLAVLRRIQSIVPGDNVTPQVGAGSELATIRPYQPGDDVRYIDWNVTARMREPHVRVHVGERALTAWLVLDVSPSMAFGTAQRRKTRRRGGREPSRSATWRRGGGTGSACWPSAGGEPRVLRPQPGPARAARPARAAAGRADAAAAAEPRAGGTTLTDAVGRLRGLARARGLVVMVSDFRGPRDWETPLRTLRARHGVLAVEVRDPRELELPAMGDVWFTDPETGSQRVVNTSRRRVRRRFAEAAAAERAEVAAALRRAGADHLVLSTGDDWLKELAGHLRRADHIRRGAMAAGGPGRAAAGAHAMPAGDDPEAVETAEERRPRRRRRRARDPEATA